MNPARDIHHTSQSFVELLQPGIQKIVIRIANVAAQTSGPYQLILNGCAVIGHHATKRYGKASVGENYPKKIQVVTNRLERAGRIEQHESIFEGQTDALEKFHCLDILLDGDLFVKSLQSLLAAGFQTHINQVESRISHGDKEFAIYGISPAVYFPND